ncbi:carboxymuconolactone decarboxylase family protein [Salinisphaera sp. P385]|uniref:Carboxymuconolactone decarboxylase family protein n=1 Tax=Spectribacter acetivorans TaxID=3075603 RepID=A0ABU3B822_9GAMM|nr:carboxymuconolactone decarboxylase family protein [Salinisphaera sp. P385]MDT0618611.1 carboxymuconolactone decarboxylase family protein [Salinisphaera sp. P385]
MSEVAFENVRFDPDQTPFHDLAKAMAKAFGYTAELQLDKQLAQLIRLRVAQKNNCAYCLILHSQTAREIGIDAAKIDGLGSWWESRLYSEAEIAALTYSDALTEGDRPGFEAIHAAAAQHFSENEIAELAAIVINMNLWTRLKLAQGAVPVYR